MSNLPEAQTEPVTQWDKNPYGRVVIDVVAAWGAALAWREHQAPAKVNGRPGATRPPYAYLVSGEASMRLVDPTEVRDGPAHMPYSAKQLERICAASAAVLLPGPVSPE